MLPPSRPGPAQTLTSLTLHDLKTEAIIIKRVIVRTEITRVLNLFTVNVNIEIHLQSTPQLQDKVIILHIPVKDVKVYGRRKAHD